jgi:hypothetical protein
MANIKTIEQLQKEMDEVRAQINAESAKSFLSKYAAELGMINKYVIAQRGTGAVRVGVAVSMIGDDGTRWSNTVNTRQEGKDHFMRFSFGEILGVYKNKTEAAAAYKKLTVKEEKEEKAIAASQPAEGMDN